MQDGLDGHELGLLRYWHLDDGGGRSAHELVGGHDGELKGGVTWLEAAEGAAASDTGAGHEHLYKLLDLSKTATETDIKKAYRGMALRYHPDRNPGPDAEEKFKQVRDAYEILTDPHKRARYDAMGMDGLGQGSSGLDPLQEMLMRQMGMRTGGGLPKAREARHALPCTLEDVYCGAHKTVQFVRINSPRGTQKKDSKIVHVDKGMDHNCKIVFRDDGDYIPGQCEAGDRIIILQLQTHARFVRKGDDLLVHVEIPLLLSLTGGGTVGLVHLDTRCLHVSIPLGSVTPHDHVMVVQGEGMPVKGQPFVKGDLYLQFKVVFPAEVSNDCAALVRQAIGGRAAMTMPFATVDENAEDVELVRLLPSDLSLWGQSNGGAHTQDDLNDDDDNPEAGAGGQQCAQQ
mmetsp:Transcript_45923/g.67372  ORF Transcript_45923/g.67372 Transcript_45923/m.67372 type:complete len:401 (-) Transcript_45923:53-1255(-)